MSFVDHSAKSLAMVAGSSADFDSVSSVSTGLDSGFWLIMLATGTANGLGPKLLFRLQIADAEARVLRQD